MSSESEVEQLQTMNSESEEEQSAGSETEEVDSNSATEEERDSEEEEKENDTEGEEQENSDEGEREENNDINEKDEENTNLPKKRSKLSKKGKKIPGVKPKNALKSDLLKEYEENNGKTLLVHFPHKLTTDDVGLESYVKKLCNRIIKIRRPQKGDPLSCWVDFNNTEDRDEAYKELEGIEINGQRLHVELPESKRKEYMLKSNKEGVEQDQQNSEDLKAISSTIIVKRLPSESTISDIKTLFPEAVDIQISLAQGQQDTVKATVKFPTPAHATEAKRHIYLVGRNKLQLLYAKEKNSITKTNEMHGRFTHDLPKTEKGKHKREEFNTESPSSKKKKQYCEEQTEVAEDGIQNIKERKIIKGKTVNKAERQEILYRPKEMQFNTFHARKFLHNRPLRMPYATYGTRGIFNAFQANNWQQFMYKKQFNNFQFSNDMQFGNGREFGSRRELENDKQSENDGRSENEGQPENEERSENEGQFENQMELEDKNDFNNKKQFKKANQFRNANLRKPFISGRPKIHSVQFNNQRKFDNGRNFMYQKQFSNVRQFENKRQFNNKMQIENEGQFENGEQFKNGNQFQNDNLRKPFDPEKPKINSVQFKKGNQFNSEQQLKSGKQFIHKKQLNNGSQFDSKTKLNSEVQVENERQLNNQNQLKKESQSKGDINRKSFSSKTKVK